MLDGAVWLVEDVSPHNDGVSMYRTPRAVLWSVLAIGVALIVMPFAISLPGKASAGQRMINGFHPIMQPANVGTTVDYYNKTFVPLRPVSVLGNQLIPEAPKLIATLSKQLHMPPSQVQQFLGSQFPATAKLLQGLPKLQPVFTRVPPGLDHYLPLVTTMRANVDNYSKIDSLPDFRLFTWFFVVPGVLLAGLAAWPLLASRRERVLAAPASAA